MRKLFFKSMLLLCALIVGSSNVWADTYEQLTSIASIDENAEYVLGIDGTGFHYSGTSSWGLTALPTAQTPLKYTLKKAQDGESFTAETTISNTKYYLQVPTSNTFSMATSTGTNTDLIIGTTQISGTNYAVANKTTTTRHLRINGTSGLRSYAGTTGTMAFFYKVVGAAPAYTITAQSNNNTFGTVSLEGSVITGSPNAGYRYASPAYTISPANSATISQDGNTFTVTPSANTTITINFEPIPTHTATFNVNGETTSDSFAEGADIVFPDDPASIEGKIFKGWVETPIVGSIDSEPSFVTSAVMGESSVIYYAVFATASGSVDTWTEIDLTNLTSSDIIVISNGTYAMNNDGGTANAPTINNITVVNSKITSAVGDNLKWNVSGNSSDGYTFYPNGTTNTWLYCNTTSDSGSNNNIRVGTGNRKVWSLDNSGYLVVDDTYTARFLSIYNNTDFRGYTNINNAFVPKFYKYASETTYSAYCTTVSALPVPTIVFKNASDEVITSLDIVAQDMSEVSVTCLDENDDPIDASISVESSDETVAEYDGGYAMAYKSGSITLTATFAGNASYQGTSAELAVNVSKASSTTTVEVEVDNTDVYTATEGGLAIATVKDAGGNAIAGAEVTWTSSDTRVATIDEDGNITLVAAGTTTITATYAENDIYLGSSAEYELTLTSSKPQETNVSITPNYEFYGKNAQFSGDTYDELIGSKENISVTYTRNTGSTYANTTAMRFYKANTLEIEAPFGYAITSISLTLAGTSSDITTDAGTYTPGTGKWTGNAHSVTFSRPSNASSYATISNIAITLAETVTVGAAGYTTYVTKQKVSFDGVTAYIAKSVNAETITLEEIEEAPVGTAVIIKAAAGTYPLTALSTNPTVSGNILLASNGTITGDASTIYALGVGKTGDNQGEVGFFLVKSGQTIPAGKAYLSYSAPGAPSMLRIEDEVGVITNIEDVEASNKAVKFIENGQLLIKRDNVVYDTMGRIIR